MPLIAAFVLMLGFAGFGGGELFLILACMLALFVSGHLPPFMGRLGREFRGFRDEFDKLGEDAGRSVGGIYGKPAAEALTPDNHTAEFYDPAAFQKNRPPSRFKSTLACRISRWLSFCLRLIRKTMARSL
jgi:Sec-independent protein translocase protein TatA